LQLCVQCWPQHQRKIAASWQRRLLTERERVCRTADSGGCCWRWLLTLRCYTAGHTVYLQQRLRPEHQNGTTCLCTLILYWFTHRWLTASGPVAAPAGKCFFVCPAIWLTCAIQSIGRTLIMRSEPTSLGSRDVIDSRIPCFLCILFTNCSFALYLTVVC